MLAVTGDKQRTIELRKTYRDLLKHSGIYGLGQILSRLASFLLLPVYTNYLRPADYGCIAILDLTVGILGILIGAGMGAAITRYHFEFDNDIDRSKVWWTGLTFIACMASVVVGLAWLFHDELAHLTLGASIEQGGFYYTLVLPTLWLNTIEQVLDGYLRVRKWSGVSVSINLVRLLLNIGLNVYFLAALYMGITGILYGNLITSVVTTVALFTIFYGSQKTYTFDRPLVRKLGQFGAPMIMTALLSTVMHQADRYLLRLFFDVDQVGIYSLAYAIGQAVNTLCLLPFSAIWGVVVYEIAHHANAKSIYGRVFEYYVYGLALIMFGVSLFAEQLLALMVAKDYQQSAGLIPIVCLAYLFFSLHEHFRVPVMLSKRTTLLPLVFAVAAVTNIGANLILIPLLGLAGAAWASVVTFATFSFIGLWRYRNIERYDYPLLRCGAVLLGMVVCYIVFRSIACLNFHYLWLIAIATCIWIAWVCILFGPLAWRFLGSHTFLLALRRRLVL